MTPNQFVAEVGAGVLFFKDILTYIFKKPISKPLVAEQIWKVSIQSLPTTAIAGFFVGGIMTIQFTLLAQEFGAMGYLGGLGTSATFREVGPLLIAFMLSGKVGAFTAAELGTMKVTEQIDAIRCLGADPMQEIIVPRFLGIVVSSFFLFVVGLFLSLFGGMTLAIVFAKINVSEYLRHIPTLVVWPSIVGGLFKCFVFSTMLAAICTFKGFTTTGGAKGVGRSVVQTAVITMIGIVLTDWATTVIQNAIFRIFGGE